MKKRFIAFIEELAKIKLSLNSFNQYAYGFDANTIRRDNLLLYFEQMDKLKPNVLLVGEAPSYQGCRLTGIPFCSEYIVLNGLNEIGLFGKSNGYRKTNEFERVHKEPSATIVWGTISTYNPVPLLWNAFPFHPFKDGNGRTNRTPTTLELKIGERFLRDIAKLFNIEVIVALGNNADKSLNNLDMSHEKVRHPAQGGKNQFVAGLNTVMKRFTSAPTRR